MALNEAYLTFVRTRTVRLHRLEIWLPIALTLFVLPTNALAASWQEAIAAVERNSAALNERADAMNEPFLGTAYNEIDAREHSCAILGRMLGRAEAITHLEKEPPSDTASGHELRVAAQSLANWVVAAENALALSKQRRVQVWNLDCVGHVGIASSEYVPTPEGVRTFYDLSDDGRTLRVLGDVERGFADSIRSALDDNPDVEVVALGSAGGFVVEALSAGVEIRSRGLETTLWNNCYSACPLVFLAGTNRTIWSPYPELGFHEASRNGLAVPPDDPLYGLIEEYVSAMGSNSDVVLALMLSTPPESMHVADLFVLCESKVALWVQRACTADK